VPDHLQAQRPAPPQATKAVTPKQPPPMPKPPAKAPAADRVPDADELTHPAAAPSLEHASNDGIAGAITHAVEGLYRGYNIALERVLTALAEPPPPPDRSFALELVATLATTLASLAIGSLGSALTAALKGKVSDASQQALWNQFRVVSKDTGTAIGGWLKDAGRAPRGPAEHGPDEGTGKLLDAFAFQQRLALNAMQTNAQTTLDIARDAMMRSDPAEVSALANALIAHVNDHSHFDEFRRRLAIEWLNFSAAISVGPRKPGEPAMQGANDPGGPSGTAWRKTHQGFVEIVVDLPDVIRETEGLQFVGAAVQSDGPGAAEVLRGDHDAKLVDLRVYRRIWIGQNKLQRSPDIVLTPDGSIEVNTHSSMLAALAIKPLPGMGIDFQDAWSLAAHEDVELESLIQHTYGQDPVWSKDADKQIRALMRARMERANDAQKGARALLAWLRTAADAVAGGLR
jgi:hypothetical protein